MKFLLGINTRFVGDNTNKGVTMKFLLGINTRFVGDNTNKGVNNEISAWNKRAVCW